MMRQSDPSSFDESTLVSIPTRPRGALKLGGEMGVRSASGVRHDGLVLVLVSGLGVFESALVVFCPGRRCSVARQLEEQGRARGRCDDDRQNR